MLFKKLRALSLRLKLYLQIEAQDSESYYILFGIMGLIGFVMDYFFWSALSVYESMPLRIVAIFLYVGLILKNYWPEKLKLFLPVYWYFTLLYSIPFFFTFLLLKNNFSEVWLQASMIALFYLIILTTWVSLLILLILGTGLAWICYISTSHSIFIPEHIIHIMLSYATVLFVAVFLVHRKNTEKLEKQIKHLLTLTASIAHELRTPLRAISSGASGLKKHLPTLIDAYQQARAAKLPVEEMAPIHRQTLNEVLDIMQAEAHSAFTVIDMLLVKFNQEGVKESILDICSIEQCVQEALRRYPFDTNEREQIHWVAGQDFLFLGNEILTIHILFNLIKNALYYIQAVGKGKIYIWIEQRAGVNELHFKDTGKGIPAKILPHIFDRFFTRTQHGTGIGLTFCRTVMRSFGGDITCRSKEKAFTEFILSFPEIPADRRKNEARKDISL